MEINKQIALVTGSSRGIGRAIAVALAETGRHVIVNYLAGQSQAEETRDIIQQAGGSCELAQFDVSNTAAAKSNIQALLEKHKHIDVLVNNAGIRDDMLMVWMEEKNWRSVLDTNLTGFYNVTKPIVKEMMLHRFGRIVNIASTSGQVGMAGQVNYSAAKAGLIGASQALAKEIAKRSITVNVVSPGFIETDMLDELPVKELAKTIPMGRIGTCDEVAAAVVFLCSNEASYITGQTIGINGGIC